MSAYGDMTTTDCKTCQIQRATYSSLSFKRAPSPICWIRVTDKGVVARGIAAFCQAHRLQHFHYANEVQFSGLNTEYAVRAEYTAWIRKHASDQDSWMPNSAKWCSTDVQKIFYGSHSGVQVICDDTVFNSYTLVCTRNGYTVDTNPCIAVENRQLGPGAPGHPSYDPGAEYADMDHMRENAGDVLVYSYNWLCNENGDGADSNPCLQDGSKAIGKTKSPPPLQVSVPAPVQAEAPALVCLSKKKKSRAESVCRKTLEGIENDVSCIVRTTLDAGGRPRKMSTAKRDGLVQFELAQASYAMWMDCPWVPKHQILARYLYATNTTANYTPKSDLRRCNYYKAIVMHVGTIAGWAYGASGGLCRKHTKHDSVPVWHPSIPTLRKITTGTLWLMGTTGLITRVVDRVSSNGYETGRMETVLPKDPVLISAIRIYTDMQKEGAGPVRKGKRGDSSRVHYRRCETAKPAPYKVAGNVRSWKKGQEPAGVGMVGQGIDMDYVAEGVKLIENSMERLSKEAIDGEGSKQRTALALLHGLMEVGRWHDTQRLQDEAQYMARQAAEHESIK